VYCIPELLWSYPRGGTSAVQELEQFVFPKQVFGKAVVKQW
jgi:hypothetical protein